MHFKQKIYNRCNKRGRYILFMKQIRKILVVTMAIAIAATMMLSLKMNNLGLIEPSVRHG